MRSLRDDTWVSVGQVGRGLVLFSHVEGVRELVNVFAQVPDCELQGAVYDEELAKSGHDTSLLCRRGLRGFLLAIREVNGAPSKLNDPWLGWVVPYGKRRRVVRVEQRDGSFIEPDEDEVLVWEWNGRDDGLISKRWFVECSQSWGFENLAFGLVELRVEKSEFCWEHELVFVCRIEIYLKRLWVKVHSHLLL